MFVRVKQGILEGIPAISALTGREYGCFLGIPYAKPPIGELRFKPPEPLTEWDGIRQAKTEGSPCSQIDIFNGLFFGTEDCLYLNVYTPQPPDTISNLKPVMIFIHGGGFFAGSGSPYLYGPDYLIGYDVVLVTFNYRLHALGFLNLGIAECAGNCGLKDQQLALKWIRDNIQDFGGDPNNVTIFGESAGASSVHLHMIAPSSKGLFNKAIMQSGSVFSPWSFTSNPLERATELSRKLGFESDDPNMILQYLKFQSVQNICNAAYAMDEELKQMFPDKIINVSFSPSVETIHENAFLPDHPRNLLKFAEPIPVIAGLNNKEGRLTGRPWSLSLLDSINENLAHLVWTNVPCSLSQLQTLSEDVKKFYFEDRSTEDMTDKYVDLITDFYFMNFYETIDHIVKSELPAYVYEFSFHGKYNVYTRIFMRDFPFLPIGAAHADELPYIFRQKFLLGNVPYEEPELRMIYTMCTLWTNFAKTGNPTEGFTNVEWKPSSVDETCFAAVAYIARKLQEYLGNSHWWCPTNEITNIEWKPSTEDEPYHLQIGHNVNLVRGKVLNERLDFWKKYLR